MIVPRRPQHPPPPISQTTELALHHFSLSSTPVSPPSTPPRGHSHKPSTSKPMIWLTRNTSSSSNTSPHGVAAAPIRISEPRFDSSLDIFNVRRSGPLGSGAMVVRTPQEALSGTSTLFDDGDDGGQRKSASEAPSEEAMGLPMLADGPPPVPSKSSLESSTPTISASTHSSLSSFPVKDTSAPPCPSRPPPPAPLTTSTVLRPVIKTKTSPSLAENLPPVPPLPVNVSATPPQPPFESILLSPVPSSAIDPSKIIVTIETSSATHRTTLRTLISRPSYLSNYVTSLLPRKSVAASLYSNASDVSELPDNSFNAMFHDHLASSGFISQSTMNIHIFLDRPSAPYVYILSYLRTPLFTSEHPAIIPRAVQLASSSRARLEALLELRDEANYLGLDELFRLCNDEICSRRSTASHARAGSMSSSASIHSLHTVQEGGEPHDMGRSSSRSSGKSTRGTPSSAAAPRERSQDRVEYRANTPNSRKHAITSWI
ncbi:hypothetical protein DFJ58DRAFT_769738 [Suillus subalutaceus]|uniref:uncharacterized protein n=1 Tax=Suillus subalutaceus TaxID=48586 RepID=UPI001B872A03|nr:uncharacterized protein DFJ58DRAFT_769738 [Suillus subalutaceus]KAG1866554.1 hypothetical protein DFJ58DRAFT_769738 [Suillus subalutaceus]